MRFLTNYHANPSPKAVLTVSVQLFYLYRIYRRKSAEHFTNYFAVDVKPSCSLYNQDFAHADLLNRHST